MEPEETISVTPETLPQQLKKIRQKRSLTQKELAEKANVSQQAISAIENGRLDPSIKVLLIIAGILGVALLIKAFTERG